MRKIMRTAAALWTALTLCLCCVPHALAATMAGDINGDGNVNNKDLTRLFQYLSGYDVTVVEAALDTNGDGNVNNKDLTRLFQYLSGYDVQLSTGGDAIKDKKGISGNQG